MYHKAATSEFKLSLPYLLEYANSPGYMYIIHTIRVYVYYGYIYTCIHT